VSPAVAVAAAVLAASPFAGARFYVDPHANARQQASAWRASRPADARLLARIGSRPQADWFTEPEPFGAADARVDEIVRAGALPVLVAYFLPDRDCGNYSAGGARTAAEYRRWIGELARAIGRRRAVVILEPDGLAGMDCLRPARQRLRTTLVREAIRRLERQPGVSVYVDAGHSAWHRPAEIAARLRAAGVEAATGFALNVSNYRTTAELLAYGAAVSRLAGGKHFVLDTSRNGRGPLPAAELRKPEDSWCNPPGRGLGLAPTARTGHPLADAFLWIKRPGESDGTCNGGPPAGQWWPERALELARLARLK
jgi:endoglucanase